MRRIIIITTAFLLASLQGFAQQDVRNRSVNTVVADVIAAMPAQNSVAFEKNMVDILNFAPESIEMAGKMLVPASQGGANSKIEYAISGAVSYASKNVNYKDAVIRGLEAAISASSDPDIQAFLYSQLYFLRPAPEASEPELLETLKAGEVLRAMKSEDRSERMMALYAAPDDDDFYARLAKCRKAEGAESDVIYFFGERKAASQIDYILGFIGGEFSEDAEAAAAKIGGPAAAKVLCSIISPSLLHFNGNFTKELLAEAEKASGQKMEKILEIASARHLTCFAPFAFDSKNYKVLKGVVSAEDSEKLAVLMNTCSDEDLPAIRDAYIKAASECTDFTSVVSNDIAESSRPERFYTAYAATNSDAAAEYLSRKTASGSMAAKDALKSINNINAAPALLEAARNDDSCLPSYINLIKSANLNDFDRCRRYTEAMALAKSVPVKKVVLDAMSNIPLPGMLQEVDKYLGESGIEHESAMAAKKLIVSCQAMMDGSELRRIAERTIAVFNITRWNDDQYAIEEINKILDNHKVYPVSELTEEEKSRGFEMLYDGTDLDKWIGDKVGYTSINGVINVTADFGLDSGNLYTEKEYRNFIYRFEFLFMEPAVNSGVGIRTPMGVDAAYYGMCECQILDHDDPVYVGLEPYQVHGSAYGIIPAKRVVHKPVGEWNYEEIEVRGDYIKVTLNGEVILEGNLKDACNGHNVAPDGGEVNPHTPDHRNHPGMFNHKGHISFCGHGKGLQFRNIRILDLGEED